MDIAKQLFRAIVLFVLATDLHAQALPYADADSPSEAIGMMKMTISLSALMEEKCGSRFPTLQQAIREQLESWRKLDHDELAVTEKYWQQMLKKKPSLAQQMEEMTTQAFESKLVAPFRKADPPVEEKIVRDYCTQYFRELATGVWRQRTPKLYQFLAQAPK